MTVTRFRLLLCAMLLLPLAVQAEEQGRTYVIQKGDTLWGISHRFLKDPFYWPNLWANNPDIRNPHFIYPGQTVRIYDGRIEIVPAEPAPAVAPAVPEPVAAVAVEEPAPPVAVVETAPAPAPAPVPEPVAEQPVTIRSPGGAGFIGNEDLEGIGRLVDSVDNRLLFGAGDTVFVQLNRPTRVGERFQLFDVSAKEILHPQTGKPAGYRVLDLGVVEIVALGKEVATGVIRETFREVQRGARLRPYQEPVQYIALKKAKRAVSGYLLEAYSGKIVQGQHDVIFIDKGAVDGLEIGNLVYLSRPRRATEQVQGKKELVLPDELLGMAVLIETKSRTATALVLKSAGPILRGDQVTSAAD